MNYYVVTFEFAQLEEANYGIQLSYFCPVSLL